MDPTGVHEGPARPARSVTSPMGPNERDSGMKNWKCALVAVVVLAVAGSAVADPSIGIYFDEAGTLTQTKIDPLPEMGTAYIVVKEAAMRVGGAAFSVDLPENVVATYVPPEGGSLHFGDMDGLEIGLYEYVPVFNPGDVAVLGTIEYYSTSSVIMGEISVGVHPGYTNIVVADNEGGQANAIGMTSHVTIHPTPTIGVYWDEAGTITTLNTNGGFGVTHTGYIMVKDAEMGVGGATFKLDLNPDIMLGGATPADALVLGSLTSGVEMGLYSYLPVYGSGVGVLYTIDLITFNNLMTDAELSISNHPSYDAPIVANTTAYSFESEGLTSTLTIVIPTENKAWGDVKNLYQ